MTEQTGTYVVTHAEPESAILHDIETAQVLPLSSNPGLEAHDVIEATVAPDPPLEVSWQVIDVTDRQSIALVDSDLQPTTRSAELASDAPDGEVIRTERAGTGEVHVLSVPPGETEAAVQDILEDEETVARAARLDVVRVEVRRDDQAGVVSVRYLPD